MERYFIVALEDTIDGNGNAIPAGNPINEILWDGVTEYTPPDGCILMKAGESKPQDAVADILVDSQPSG